MTTATENTSPLTYGTPDTASGVVRAMRSRRTRGILNRHIPACRVRGFGI